MSQLTVPPLEGALKRSPELLEKVFNSIHVLIAYLDPQFNFIRVNRNYAAAEGRDPEFYVGKNHFALYPNPANEVIFRRVVETGRPYFAYEKAFEYGEHPERGATYWDWSLEPVIAPNGAVEGLVFSLVDVTARRRSEANLAEAQRLAHVGSWEWDVINDRFYWSDETFRIYGLVPQSIAPTYKTVLDIAHPEDRERLAHDFEIALREGDHLTIGHRVTRPDGSVRFVHREGEVLRDKDRRAVRMRGTVQDITERKLAEDALRRREQQFRSMVEAWPDIIARVDKAQRHLYVSPSIEKVTGLPPEAFIGKTHRELGDAPAETIRLWEANIEKVLETGQPQSVDFSLAGPEGTLYYERRAVPEFGADGKIQGVLIWARDVTERKRVEDRLRESEDRFEAMAEAIEDVFWMSTPGVKQMLYISPGYERIFGRSCESLYQAPQSFMEAVLPEDKPKLATAFENHTRGIPYQLEYRIVRPDGAIRWMHERGFPVRDEQGNLRAMTGIVSDITAGKVAQETLREREALLREAQRLAAVGSWDWTAATDTVIWSDELYRIAGRDRRLPAPNFREPVALYTRHSAAHADAAVAKALQTGAPYEVDLELIRPDGTTRWVVARGEAKRDATGRIVGLRGTVQDITERKLAEEKLRRSEQNLAQAQRIALLGNWDWDIVRNTLRWSDEIYRIFGLEPQTFGASYDAFIATIHPEDRAAVTEAVNASLEGRKPYGIDHRIVMRDGSIRYVHEQGEVYRDASGKPVRMIGTVQDITERKLGEIMLRKVNRALRTLSRCNQTLIHARDEDALLRDMCRTIVEEGGYRAAWIGYAEHDPHEPVRPVAQVGFEPADVERFAITWDEAQRHPVGTAVRRDAIQIVRDARADPGYAPWHDQASKYGYQSLVSLPLDWNRKTAAGVLTIYASERNAFDDEEVKLLKELSDDLCYGIVALRTGKEREQATKRLQKSMEGTIQAVASTVEMRDPYTAGHQRRVAQLATAIAREIGLSDEETVAMRMAGTVHDIGKVYVPAEILNRPGPLSEIEITMVKTHAQVGYNILKGVEFTWPVAELVRQHHERLDGSGYPQGLKGDQILLGARILAVADVVEAMASHRPYRPGLGLDEALHEITTYRGTRYDPGVVDACVALFRENRFKFTVTPGPLR